MRFSPRFVLLLVGLTLVPGLSLVAAEGQVRPASSRSLAHGPPLSKDDQQRLAHAIDAYNAGHPEEAKPDLLALAGRYPGVLAVQSSAGMVLAETGELARATPYLERAHQLDPGDAALTANLALVYLRTNDAAKALPLLKEACSRDPANAEDRLALAHALLLTHQPGEAADAFAAASKIAGEGGAPPSADLAHDWAVALLEAKRTAEAKRVLDMAPSAANSAPLQQLLGEVDEKQGNFESAVGHLRRAAEIEPSEPNLYAYGNEMLRHWTFAPAIQIFRYAVKQFPQSSRLQMGLGIALFGSNEFAAAANVFASMLGSNPSDTAAADLLGRSCSAQSGTPEAACASLTALARKHPGNAPLALYAAITLLHQASEAQQLALAEQLLRQSIAADPKLPEAWYEMGELQQTRGNWQASATSLEHAIALRPAYAEAHYRLSRAYAHTGHRDEAQQQIALQQQSSEQEKAAQESRMREVMVFLTTSK